MELLNQIARGIEKGEDEQVVRLVGEAIDGKLPTASILNDGLIAGYCEDQDPNWCPCYVYSGQSLSILNVPIDPGDELTVILRPAPGALPELPGFEDDDERDTTHGCPEDLDGDGFVNVTDLLFVLANWGTPIADVNGDDNTDVADLLAILAKWGACFPV